MVDRIHSMIDDTKRRITISYHIALILVALVIIAIACITGRLVTQQINDASIINLSGKQRMLSQRIALLTHDIAEMPDDARRASLQLLKSAVEEMENSHQTLIADAAVDDGLIGVPNTLKPVYFAEPVQLNQQVREYLRHAHDVLHLAVKDVTLDQPDVIAVLKQAHGILLNSLDNAVQHYQQETIDRFNLLHRIVLVLSIVGLCILLVIGLVVFKPAIAYVSQAQKRLVELNQLKGDFLANMSHEIRTPMNGIFGMTELLLDSSLNARQQHYARTLQSSADHLLGLINDVLDFSKLEAGQMKLDPVRFNLVATIEDVLEILATRAREKNLELLLRYVPGTPRFIVADPGRIRQVLFNLIGNAIKFTDQGYVMVHVEMMPDHSKPDRRLWLRLRIEDTGVGIPEDKIASLFEKFMQVESGSTRARQGTGLGLAICRNLVKLMGGDIVVQSQHGKGTVFAWQIPLAEAGEPQPKADRHMMLAEKRVLLVDDLAPNRLLYKEALIAAGLQCLVAENAQEALSILNYETDSGRALHAVITDYMMPVMDGIGLTLAIKNNPRFKLMPVIILTSAGEQGLIKRFSDAGASACLTKPVMRQQLFDTLVHVLEAPMQAGTKREIITAEASTAVSTRHLFAHELPLYGTHVLLVEDNRVNLEITTEMLLQFGCEVATAGNGKEAIDAVRKRAFDLIFMDCQMPEMDGFEAAQHITQLKQTGQIAPVPIVALTANALKGDRERCLESGMDDYLSKPMRKANLEAILLKWLREKLEARANERALKPQGKPNDEELAMTVIPMNARAAQQANCIDAPIAYGVDGEAFAATRDMLGSKLVTVLSYYLEDAEEYINRIAEAAQQNDPAGAIAPAHTLKSSSRQFGVTALAELAAQAEAAAQSSKHGNKIEEFAALLPGMQEALQRVRPFFQSMGAV